MNINKSFKNYVKDNLPWIYDSMLKEKYWLYKKVLRNPRSKKCFKDARPSLRPEQVKVVQELLTSGIAVTSYDTLMRNDHSWSQLCQTAEEFENGRTVTQAREKFCSGMGTSTGKEYLVRLYPDFTDLGDDNLLLNLAIDDSILNIVNTYLGLWSKLLHVDLWYTISANCRPQGLSDGDRRASQRWHRDPEDERLVKVFVYLSDVDDQAGPLEYVPGSMKNGRREFRDLWPGKNPLTGNYPPDEEFEKSIPSSSWVSATGRKGTIVFCDTYGFHRGGFATGRKRILAYYVFVTPSSLFPKRFLVRKEKRFTEFPPAAKFAVT